MSVVFCRKLKCEAEGFDTPPYPGALGERIKNEISKEAWATWIKQQTILINENRLKLFEPSARELLEKAMINFLFED